MTCNFFAYALQAPEQAIRYHRSQSTQLNWTRIVAEAIGFLQFGVSRRRNPDLRVPNCHGAEVQLARFVEVLKRMKLPNLPPYRALGTP